MASSKKYKLHSVDTGEKSVCAFYSSAAGCRNGDKCKFLHSTSTSQSKVSSNTVELSDDSSAVSSESEGTNGNNRPRPNQVKIETPTDVDGSDPFECVAQLHTGDIDKKQQKRTQKKRKSTDKSENNPASSQKKKKVKIDDNPSTSSSNKFSSFVSNLPVASFSVLGTNSATTATPEKKDEKITSPDNMTNIRNTPKKSKDETQRILPESTAVGRKWQKAVIHSRKHQRYDNSYDFARYKENDTKNGIQSTWIKTKPFGSWCESHPQAIAIDCEMCESQDPLSGAKNAKALCRLSVVNAENPEDVLLDTLVKPAWPVSDYRTRINGIAKEHLENVEFTLRHAQAFMMALCCEETVIVGHAVHNDLVALNMEHDVVADSSFLFHAKDSPANATPSLKDTVMTLFKKEMPETHDSVNDSIKALECVLHWIKNDGKVELVQRSLKFQKQGHQLFVHRIPKICKPDHLTNMFLKQTDIQPSQVEEIQFSGNLGKTHINFKSARHANLVFDTLEGNPEEEKSGRLQKKVYLRNGDYIRVRKMVHAKRSEQNKNGTNKFASP